MIKRDFLGSLLGYSFAKIYDPLDGGNPYNFEFCGKFNSPHEFFTRPASLVVSPIIFTLAVPAFLIFAAAAAITEVSTAQADKRKEDGNGYEVAGTLLVFTIPALLTIFISPIINLLDMIGGVVNTALPESSSNAI